MPELKLGLNDRVLFEGHSATHSTASSERRSSTSAIELEDIRFHQCVRLDRFDTERIIGFVPPDGDFDLMTYRISIPQVRAQSNSS